MNGLLSSESNHYVLDRAELTVHVSFQVLDRVHHNKSLCSSWGHSSVFYAAHNGELLMLDVIGHKQKSLPLCKN